MSVDTPKPLAQALTRHQTRLIEASATIRAAPAEQLDFLHSIQCQCALPYRNPGEGTRVWDRKQGYASLRIEAGSALDPTTREFVQLGLPYGEKPRLVLIHLASEAVRTGSPLLDVKDSMTAFARSIGLATNGPHLRSLQDQLTRLACATVRFGLLKQDRAVQINTQIITAFDLWFPKEHSQRVLWPTTVRMSDEFFASLAEHAVPLDHRAIAALAGSSMALDVYVWLAQRLHRIPPGRPQFVPWSALFEQFGQGFARVRDFRRRFLGTLQQVQAVYPPAKVAVDQRGLTLHHSPPPVASKVTYLDKPRG